MGLVFWRWGIDPHHHWLTPTASGPTPTAGMTLPRLLIHLGTMATDGQCLSAVPLIRRHKSDATMAVPMVVPLHKCRYPCAGFLHALEGPAVTARKDDAPAAHQAALAKVADRGTFCSGGGLIHITSG